MADDVLPALAPHLRAPIRTLNGWPADGGPQDGTLVIRAVDELTVGEQRAMLAWSTATHTKVQIISLSAKPLFPLVSAGEFLEDLYYHLNTIYLQLDAVGV